MHHFFQPVRLLVSVRAYQPANSVFSLTTNQHQSGLSAQKPTSKQALYILHHTTIQQGDLNYVVDFFSNRGTPPISITNITEIQCLDYQHIRRGIKEIDSYRDHQSNT